MEASIVPSVPRRHAARARLLASTLALLPMAPTAEALRPDAELHRQEIALPTAEERRPARGTRLEATVARGRVSAAAA